MDYAAVQNVANKIFQEPLSDLIARSNPFLSAITKKAVASDQIYIKTRMSGSHSAGPIADGATVTTDGTETSNYVPATLPWSTYISKFRVNKRLLAQMQYNPGGLGALLKDEIEQAALDLADSIAKDMWAGSVTNGLVGMQSIIDNDNTYAGIDRTVGANANWKAVVVDGAGAEISTELLYSLDDAFFARNKYGFREMPGMFTSMVTPALLTKYASLMETIDLASLSTAHFVNQANSTGRLGYNNVGFLGVPWLREPNLIAGAAAGDTVNTGRIYYLDMNRIHLCVLNASGEAQVHQVQGYQSAPVTDGIKAEIEFLGNKGEVVEGYVKTYVQLATDNPAKAGCLLKNVLAV